MRKYALTKAHTVTVKKVMIYHFGGGYYLFMYETFDSVFSSADAFFDTLADAESCCSEDYGIEHDDWVFIDDPLPYSQHDTFLQIRVVGREQGDPQWGKYEVYENDAWIPYV